MEQTKSGIIIPRSKKPALCGFCGQPVFAHNEVNGRIHFRVGKVICISCRVLSGKQARGIVLDVARNIGKDRMEKQRVKQNKANDQAIEVALASQDNTRTKMNKK